MRNKIDDLYEDVFDQLQKFNADEMKTNTFFDYCASSDLSHPDLSPIF